MNSGSGKRHPCELVCALMVVLILLVVSLASARNLGTEPQFGRGSSNQSRMERPVNKKRLESSRPQAEPRLIFCAPSAALLFRRGFPLCETSLPASDSMCRLRFFGRLAFGPFGERRKQINWHRQNGRGVMRARNFLHRL